MSQLRKRYHLLNGGDHDYFRNGGSVESQNAVLAETYLTSVRATGRKWRENNGLTYTIFKMAEKKALWELVYHIKSCYWNYIVTSHGELSNMADLGRTDWWWQNMSAIVLQDCMRISRAKAKEYDVNITSVKYYPRYSEAWWKNRLPYNHGGHHRTTWRGAQWKDFHCHKFFHCYHCQNNRVLIWLRVTLFEQSVSKILIWLFRCCGQNS